LFGHDPDFVERRDNSILVKYIKKYGVDQMKEMIKLYFQDDWGKKCGFSIPIFQQCTNKILTKMSNAKKKKDEGYGFSQV
jgi:hypothetical protein